MIREAEKKMGLKTFLLFLALYTFYPLFFFPQYYFGGYHWTILIRLFTHSYTWIFLTPVMLWVGRRFSIEYPFRLKNLIILCLAPFLLTFVQVSIFMFIWQILLSGLGLVRPVNWNIVFYLFTSGTFFCAAILALYQAFNYFRKFRDREFRLQEAELQALKMQLNPHFLFNTLNAISEFTYSSPKVANETITQLSQLLRISLKSGKRQEITLQEELEFLRKYLQIQETLLEERLKVRWNIDPGTLQALVPNMILQPLIENSIIHGISHKETNGLIEISSERRNGVLYLNVLDNGENFNAEQALINAGVGLTNVKARLVHLYGERQEFKIGKSPGGETLIRLEIPFRERTLEE